MSVVYNAFDFSGLLECVKKSAALLDWLNGLEHLSKPSPAVHEPQIF